MSGCILLNLIKKSSEDKKFENDLKCIIDKLNDLYKKQIKLKNIKAGERLNLYLHYVDKGKKLRHDIFNIVLVVIPLSTSILIGFLSLSYTKLQKILCNKNIEDLIIKVTTVASIVLTILIILILIKLIIDCHKDDDNEFIKYVMDKYYD